MYSFEEPAKGCNSPVMEGRILSAGEVCCYHGLRQSIARDTGYRQQRLQICSQGVSHAWRSCRVPHEDLDASVAHRLRQLTVPTEQVSAHSHSCIRLPEALLSANRSFSALS